MIYYLVFAFFISLILIGLGVIFFSKEGLCKGYVLRCKCGYVTALPFIVSEVPSVCRKCKEKTPVEYGRIYKPRYSFRYKEV